MAPRFQGHYSAHSRSSLLRHLLLLLLMGFLLVVAAARPTIAGSSQVASGGQRLLLLIDASASMYATDVEPLGSLAEEGQEPPKNRLEVARRLALSLVDQLDEGAQIALASYSGEATLHLPMIDDRPLILEGLRTLESHNFYQNTGSSLTRALDTALHFVDEANPHLQVLLLSDGELPQEENFSAPLEALAAAGVAVNTVAIGQLQGQARVIYDFRDIRAGKKDRRVLREYTTRRVDQYLQQIARTTGGRFEIADPASVRRLLAAINQQTAEGMAERPGGRSDLSALPLAAFLLCFLWQIFWLRRAKPWPDNQFDIDQLGQTGPWTSSSRTRAPQAQVSRTPTSTAQMLWILLALGGGCADTDDHRFPEMWDSEDPGSIPWKTHSENEQGIQEDRQKNPAAARRHYERSLGYGYESHIPAYNLARSVLLTEQFAEAHELFQEALKIAPQLAEAHFNDGVTLYRWGTAERDPRNCQLERTRDLWKQALRRFEIAQGLNGQVEDVPQGAETNRRFVAKQLEEIERLINKPPEACNAASSGAAGDSKNEPPPPSGPNSNTNDTNPPQDQQNPTDPPPPATPPPATPPPATPPPATPPSATPPPQQGPDATPKAPPPPSAPPQATAEEKQREEQEREQVQQALERIERQAKEEGKYHRRTRAEQFGKASWENPEEEIWW